MNREINKSWLVNGSRFIWRIAVSLLDLLKQMGDRFHVMALIYYMFGKISRIICCPKKSNAI